ncbi:hypothetical protein [Methanobrevibacter sp. UBA188]|uniref:hypothetical protein n=1 Tax=Methanobrevibacter sp. UBA188 TaxID=1915473 RepID=UPI0025D16DCD|nr:hypothetical protein [Methanobrevibacter sp. UBA188]
MDRDILEKLSDLEHQQWCEWSGSVSKEIFSLITILDRFEDDLTDDEKLTVSRIKDKLARWDNLQVNYFELSENEKEKDRVYAKKVLSIVND